MKSSYFPPEVHLNRLEPLTSIGTAKERSMLTYSGNNRLGLNCRIATYLRDQGANIRSCTERLHDVDPILGSQYVIEASEEDMASIDEEAIRHFGQDCDDPIKSSLVRHPVIFVAKDEKGMLAKIYEFLLQRKMPILANETVTFMAELPEELGGDGSEVQMATICLMIGLPAHRYEDHLEILKSGLEYLEHRYKWCIHLEKGRGAKESMDRFGSHQWKGMSADILRTTLN